MKNWCFLVLVFSMVFGINAQVTKEIKGNLVDMKTSYDVEKVELSLTSNLLLITQSYLKLFFISYSLFNLLD